MRLSSLAAALILFTSTTPALAQEWKEFESRQDRFTCNFPGDPTITETTFMSQFGHRLPARIYSVQLAPNHKFSVTVADYSNITQMGLEKQKNCPAGSEACRGGSGAPGNSTGPGYSKADRAGAITYATWQFMQRDAKVTHLLWTNISLVEGHQIRLVNNADKSQTAASVFMHEEVSTSRRGPSRPTTRSPGSFTSRSDSWTRTATAFAIRTSIATDTRSPPSRGRVAAGALVLQVDRVREGVVAAAPVPAAETLSRSDHTDDTLVAHGRFPFLTLGAGA